MMNKPSNVRQFERSFSEKKQLLEKQDFVNIAILTAVILAVGIYLICTTVLIAKDGTLYIDCAKQFVANNLVEVVRNIPVCSGYPFLIYLMHKTAGLFTHTESLQSWIVSAQAVSLLSKLIASAALYFAGSYFAGRKAAFWGVLILSILPDSAEYGSDALTEWPQLMFLASGFLLLLLGTQHRKSWMFGWAGIATGLGYLVRPECGQVVLYGSVWLLFNLVRPQGKMRRTKAAGALILLLAGFLVIAIPYMRSKGYVFPKQGIWKLPAVLSVNDNTNSACDTNVCVAGIYTSKTMGNKTLTKNICETLMYYFVPGLLIGCWYYFRKQSKSTEQAFYAAAFIILNIVLLSWQISHRHFLSRRHTLALVAFTAFYIPIGIEIIAGWISERTAKGKPFDSAQDRQRWFYILLIIGIAICLPKLLKFIDTPKYGYKDVAMWLNKNTASTDIIAVPDMRIVFYAERKGLEYLEYNEKIPEQVDYIVKIAGSGDEKLEIGKGIKDEYSTWMDKKESRKLVIYKVIH
jgi:4-amino-4-deoxy-L-arabinose transferase-like glycosyltransferase